MKDLVLLVPDVAIEKTICALLDHRRQSLRIRELSFKAIRHPGRDGGVRKTAHKFLQPRSRQYDNAIVVFDYHGCGEESQKTASQIEKDVMSNLTKNGWTNANALVVVIDPELETWVWSDSPWVAKAMGWPHGDTKNMMSHLKSRGIQINQQGKPADPKEAFEQLLRKAKIPKSASIFETMAKKVSWRRCQDPSFLQLTKFLRQKFPQSN